jgi:hypothetical protein
MPRLPPAEEPTDCWKLDGEEDATTPPSLSLVLHRSGTRSEWRRAGFPVLFDEAGNPRPVIRAGRAYPFVYTGSSPPAQMRLSAEGWGAAAANGAALAAQERPISRD